MPRFPVLAALFLAACFPPPAPEDGGSASPLDAGHLPADAGLPDAARPDAAVTGLVSVTVTGPGTVVSLPAGISCPGSCSLQTSAGVVLRAQPELGAHLVRWEGDCSGMAVLVAPPVPGACTAVFALSTPTFARAYGGTAYEYGSDIQATLTGGLVMAGGTATWGAGDRDLWVVLLDGDGRVQQARAFGGPQADMGAAVQPTAEGGYMVVGDTASFGAGGVDVWVLKLDAQLGVEWERTYGGPGEDRAHAVQVLPDGGYLVLAHTDSFGAGDRDAWFLRLDAQGNVQWQTVLGGPGMDSPMSLLLVPDGFVMTGSQKSFAAGEDGLADVWVARFDLDGVPQWQSSVGAAGFDYGYAVAPTQDNGFLVAGWTSSFAAEINDAWVLKFTGAGALLWQKAYRGMDVDGVEGIAAAPDGFYLGGVTWSSGAGGKDVWVLRVDDAGTIRWQRTYGGNNWDWGHGIRRLEDGHVVVVGHATALGAGDLDAWVVKVDALGGVDSSCPAGMVQESNVSVVDTNALAGPPPMTGGTTAVTGQPSAATVTDTPAVVTSQCAAPG